MIRSNLPLPFLYRLRLRAGMNTRRTTIGVGLRSSSNSVNRTVANYPVASARPAMDQDKNITNAFIDRYEEFTDILCSAAKTGCEARHERKYAHLRIWILANYPRIAGKLQYSLHQEFNDCSLGVPVVVDYAGQKRVLDPLESLFVSDTLGEIINQDSGNLIPHVQRISDIVYRCLCD